MTRSGRSKIFIPCRGLGYVSNHIPLQVRYIKSRKENLIVTCVGNSFHTYGISHFGLLSVSGIHPDEITCMTADAYHVYTSCSNIIYAWRRGTELKHTYEGHKKPVKLMFPFGAHLISVDTNSQVNVWDIKEESLYLELAFDNSSFEITALVHPSTYINKVLFGSSQGEMQLWNLNNSKMIYRFKGWGENITCLEQSPAIDVVAVGLNSGKIVLHNLKYDETVMEFVQDWGRVTSISFRLDDHPIMVSGSTCGHLVFWDLEKRRVSTTLIRAHEKSVTSLVCLPSEPLMLTSSPDNSLKLWIFDLPDGGARLLRIREGHLSSPNFVRFHGANGHNILSCASDSTLRIFNTRTEQFNKSLGKASYNRKASKKKGRTVDDPLIMPPITQFTSETTREKEWDNIAAIHSGIPIVTTWSYDKLKMGDLKLLPERFQKKHKDIDLKVVATCLCLTHCGNFVIIGYSTGHVDRFNMQSGLWRDEYGNPKAHEGNVRGVATDTLNQVTITGDSNQIIKFWKFKCKGGEPLSTLKLEDSIAFFRAHHEGSLLAVALENFEILMIDSDTRYIVRKFDGHSRQITDAAFSPDSRWLITSSMDCSIRIWDIPSGQLIDQFATEMPCVSLTLSPTGDTLATAHVDYIGIHLWTNRTLYERITLKAISPDTEPELLTLPECVNDTGEESMEEEPDFVSPEQIAEELITLSGLPTSRWHNLLNIELIKQRNKPKQPLKTPKAAPFFLPTVSALNFQFDLQADSQSTVNSRIKIPHNLATLTDFGKLINDTCHSNDFSVMIDKLKSFGPSMIDFEIKNLSPENGGSVIVMFQFLKCIEHMLKSNKDFELAQAYFGKFIKEHGNVIAKEDDLAGYMKYIEDLHVESWKKIQGEFLYNICVVNSLKSM